MITRRRIPNNSSNKVERVKVGERGSLLVPECPCSGEKKGWVGQTSRKRHPACTSPSTQYWNARRRVISTGGPGKTTQLPEPLWGKGVPSLDGLLGGVVVRVFALRLRGRLRRRSQMGPSVSKQRCIRGTHRLRLVACGTDIRDDILAHGVLWGRLAATEDGIFGLF